MSKRNWNCKVWGSVSWTMSYVPPCATSIPCEPWFKSQLLCCCASFLPKHPRRQWMMAHSPRLLPSYETPFQLLTHGFIFPSSCFYNHWGGWKTSLVLFYSFSLSVLLCFSYFLFKKKQLSLFCAKNSLGVCGNCILWKCIYRFFKISQ